MVFARLAFVFAVLSTLCSFAFAAEPKKLSFELDVQPVLTARGCNQGACHGKQRGQNGFQLSLLAFDSDFDYAALTMHARGRRVFPAAPERSLLLTKATGEAPHGGGRRIDKGSDDYNLLLDWVASGMPRRIEGEPNLQRVETTPPLVKLAPGESKQLKVVAFYSDGSSRDVTDRATYQSNESAIIGVSPAGEIQASELPGEATIMARYMGMIDICDAAIPLPGSVPAEAYAKLPRKNFIDDLVWKKLQTLGMLPSPAISDEKFLRRVHLDVIGRLPTPDETRAFLGDSSKDKREKLVDRLLARPEYADHWATKWMDLLRPNPYRVGIKAVFNYDHWIREQFRKNRAWDKVVYDLLTAEGSTFENGAVTLFRDRRSPDELTTISSQLFLGIRLECAKCHHHPFEKWGQDDFYSLAAYFARIGRKGRGLSPPISGSEEIVMATTKGDVTHPLTSEIMTPRPLFGTAPEVGEGTSRREALAAWVTSPKNDYFAQVAANRIWKEMMGRGLVEPVDDLRATNPPANGPLLKALADKLRKQKFDVKKLIKTIALSHVYSLDSVPVQRNVADRRNHSRHYRTQLPAEVLLDAVADVTGTKHSFDALPKGSRANQVWTARVGSVFLDTFGRPDANQDPPCERLPESTVTQALHLMNSPQLHARVANSKGTAAKLAAGKQSVDEIVEELYLLCYSRPPRDNEREIGRRFFTRDGSDRRKATEDLMWALINTPEFVFGD